MIITGYRMTPDQAAAYNLQICTALSIGDQPGDVTKRYFDIMYNDLDGTYFTETADSIMRQYVGEPISITIPDPPTLG